MPRLIEMWPAHDSHMEHNGVRHVIVFEPLAAKPECLGPVALRSNRKCSLSCSSICNLLCPT